ncbi:MAG: Fe-S cluster assembly protein SufD, partial [Flavobacterium sp.]
MELKDKIIASFLAFENTIDTTTELYKTRLNSLKNFEKLGFPTKKLEAWKYTSLQSVLKNDFTIFPKMESNIEFKEVKKYFLHEIDTYKLVFIDGVFSSFLSSTTHDGLDICLMSSLLHKPKYKMILDNFYNKITPNDEGLTALNTAFTVEGGYINVPKGKIVEKPIEIIYFSTGAENTILLQPRNLIVVG